MVNVDLLAALMMGVAGSGHCLGMCGGIASMLNLGRANAASKRVVLLYNVGRITSYALFGALIGGAFSSIVSLSQINEPLAWLRLVAAFLMIAMGLYIGRWWFGLLTLERLGKHLWVHISPAAKQFLPLRKVTHALPLGFVWGWLPCGLVYSALSWAAVAGSAWSASGVMVAFGIGTLPGMFAVGMSGQWIQKMLSSVIFRHICALLLITYGVLTGYDALRLVGFLN